MFDLPPSIDTERLAERLAEIDALKTTLNILRQTLDHASIREALRVEFLWESNRIEGNTLSLRETQMVISEGMTISGKSMREHLEAINHQEAVMFVEDIVSRNVDFSESVLKQIHALMMYGIDRENAGKYRSMPVLIAGSRHTPPAPFLVQSQMDAYFANYREGALTLHPVVMSAIMHERLVTIHPFIDGNGRTARLVMNLLLLQQGFPLVIIGGDYDSRMAYYDALEQVQTGEQPSAFVDFVTVQVREILNRYITILKGF